LPITCVNWYEAYAFCIWDGGFLPSEAEWEYAAAGGGQQREYPWGTTDPGTSSEYAIYYCYYPSGSMDCTGVANIAPVGSAPAGAGMWGQLDLAGDVEKWNLDNYAAYGDPCIDCAYLALGTTDRVNRGGGYLYTLALQLPAFRAHAKPSYRGSAGFQCARSP